MGASGRWIDACWRALACGAVGLTLWSAWDGTFHYNLFSDRDLARADGFPWHIEVAGAEMTGEDGARLPGAALSVLMGLGLALADGPEGAFRVMIVTWLVGLLVLHAVIDRVISPRAAALATVAQLVHPVNVDTLSVLWNPGFVAGFAAVATGALVVIGDRRDGRALPVWVGALAVGAQLHMTAASFAAVTLPGVWGARVDRGRTWALRAAACVALLYSPFWASELYTGGFFTSRIAGHAGRFTSVIGPDAAVFQRFLLFCAGVPGGRLSGDPEPGAVAYAVGFAAFALIGGGIGLRRPALRPLALGLWLEVALWGAGLFPFMEARYAVVLVPALAVLAASAVEAAAAWRPGLLLVALWLGVLADRGSGLGAAWSLSTSPYAWTTLTEALSRIQAETGWSLAEVTGRTAWRRVDRDGGQMQWRAWPAVQLLLARRGETFPGSLAPPCALVVGGEGVGDGLAADEARALLRERAEITDIGPMIPLAGDWRMVLYTPAFGRCPTSMVQRYLDTEAEAAARPLWGRSAPRVPVALPVPVGRRVAVSLKNDPEPGQLPYALLVVLDLVPRAGGVDVTLESNQLRGYADNAGYTFAWTMERPVVRFDRADGARVEVPLADDRIGRSADVTPVRVSAAVPPGTWRVGLAGTIVLTDGDHPDQTVDAADFQQAFVDDLVVE